MAWTFATYHEVLRELRDEYDVGYADAQEMYRELRDALGHPVSPRDLLDAEFTDDVLDDAGWEVREYPDFEPEDWEGEWFEEDYEIEITAELAYEEGKTT